MSLANLFVAKLPRNLTDTDLNQIFAQYNPTSAKVMLDATTGKSKGFGFVLFASEEDGAKAYRMLNRKSTRACGHNFTLVIYPSNHDGKAASEVSHALYIRNIPMTFTQSRVKEFLSEFGKLAYCAMREDHYGSPVWVVYAEYESVDDAKNALTKLHGNNTYFQGAAPILAKYEDTDEAKRERRRRREVAMGTRAAPISGCVFPPPRPDLCSGNNSGSTESSSAPEWAGAAEGHGVRSLGQDRTVATPPRSQQSVQSVPSMNSAVPPPYSIPLSLETPEMAPFAPPMSAFSMPHNFASGTPGYCYTFGDSGQQIFIPATSFSPPASVEQFAAAQSAPLPHAGIPGDGASGGMQLLNPEMRNPLVWIDGSQKFLLSKDAINVPRSVQSQGSPSSHAGSVPLFMGAASMGSHSPQLGPASPTSMVDPVHLPYYQMQMGFAPQTESLPSSKSIGSSHQGIGNLGPQTMPFMAFNSGFAI